MESKEIKYKNEELFPNMWPDDHIHGKKVKFNSEAFKVWKKQITLVPLPGMEKVSLIDNQRITDNKSS